MVFLISILILWALPAQALLSFPEYSFAGAGERQEINGPGTIGTEFQSDHLAFSKPFIFESRFIRNERAFDASVGSLGPKRFFTNNRLKANTKLTEPVEFRLIYFDQADFENEYDGLVFVFAYHFKKWALVGYGEASTRKSEDDIGTALVYKLSDHHNIRLFASSIDFSYNKRNLEPNSYRKRPFSYGFVGRWWDGDEGDQYVLYSLRWQPRLEQVFGATNRVYGYDSQLVNVHGRVSLSDNSWSFLNFDVMLHKRFEENQTPTAEQWDSDQVDVWLQWERRYWIYGLKQVYRNWQGRNGGVIHNQTLPHIWYQALHGDYGSWQSILNVGYEFTWHRGQGADNLRSTLDRNNVLEHRLNFRYDMSFTTNVSLNLLLSIDLDEFGTGETWEGGNAQFSWVF